MKKILYFAPVVFTLLLYSLLGFIDGFAVINPLVWIWIMILFVSGVVMLKGKWYGCMGGFILGCVVIYMSMQYTGQIINERPLGILVCIYYFICGIVVSKKG